MFKFLYNKIFVNIVVDRSKSTVYIETVSKKEVISSVEEVFETTTINKKMQEFIASNISESPYNYISLLDISTLQGVVPTCEKNRLSYYSSDVESSEYRCIDNGWSCYTSKDELYMLEEKYQKIGLDFVFSPFIVLSHFFKDKIDAEMSLYILVEDNYISLSIFDKSILVFAKHLDLEHHKDSHEMVVYEEDDEELEDDSIDLEEIDAIDDIDLFDDFGDIEDLDSIEDIDEFSESKDIEEEFHQELEKTSIENEEDGFNEDYQRFALIQSSVNHFYKDERYASEFIESIYVADGIGVSSDLKRYLEEEMFLSVYIRQINLASSICELSRLELKA